MAMNYTSLSAAKGTSGSIANWVAYTLLDLPPIIDEAQALLYMLLRTREMRTVYSFTMPVGGSLLALPARFLDPIGRIYLTSTMSYLRHKDENTVLSNRNWTESSGTLGTDPFTTASGSDTVTVSLTAHGFNQDSLFYTTGAATFNGAAIVGTFPITSVVGANSFNINIGILGTTPSGTGAGGGASAIYTCDNLIQGFPAVWAIWDEQIKFDAAFSQQQLGQLQYFQSLPLLSSSNLTNFLTNRYPQLMRTACMAAAADFMQDEAEYNRLMTRLTSMVGAVMGENDGMYRGAEIDTETP